MEPLDYIRWQTRYMMKTGWTYSKYFSNVRSSMMCMNIMTNIDIYAHTYICTTSIYIWLYHIYAHTYIHTCKNTYNGTRIYVLKYYNILYDMKDAVKLTFFSKDHFPHVFRCSLLTHSRASSDGSHSVGQTRIHKYFNICKASQISILLTADILIDVSPCPCVPCLLSAACQREQYRI